ncbi:MAG TPA: energy transducer TonB [Vicinamibacterales bacterium]|nr:energy transducer TonB [Vicinamibacterales bacterium]
MEAVTGVLLERARHDTGLPRMVTASLLGHIALIAVLAAASAISGRTREADLRDVMTISLGGAPGPNAGGMTMMGSPARPRAAAPPEAAKKPSPVVPPPSAAKPAMTLPTSTRPAKTPPRPAKPTAASGATAAAAPASSAAAPGGESLDPNRGMGFGGLSTGGGLGSGSYLDVKNFCCPDYLVTMLQLIQGRWNATQQVAGETVVVFRIQRDGRLTDIELERSSGFPALDLTAQRALFQTQRVPALPSAFPDDSLTVHLRFEYRR